MSYADKARRDWGEGMPSWVQLLAEECDRTTQRAAAELIHYSAAVVNQVIANKYKGDLGAVEQAVKGALMDATVNCPVAGELRAHACLEIQRRPFAPTNSERVRLYRACNGGCPNSRK